MKFYFLSLISFYCVVYSSCSSLPTKAYMKANPAKSFKINGALVVPKYYTKFDSILRSSDDTLAFVAYSKYAYFPFGMIKTKSKINSGLLKEFHVEEKIIKTDIGNIEFKTLTHGSSKVMYSFNKTTPGEDYDIDKGEINDNDIQFINGVKVGMSLDDFYNAFFDQFPSEMKNKYKYFVIETFGAEVRHIYSFENFQLKSIKFTSKRFFDADY
ncbi:MAG: hypothetical protein ABI203_09875 [Mucilaginibacter sp.]